MPQQGPTSDERSAVGDATARADVARAVRRRRSALGLTLDVLARRTGLSKGFLSQMEAGEANPTLASLVRVADALGVPLADLFAAADDVPTGLTDGPAFSGGEQASVTTTRRPARPVGDWPAGAGRTYVLTAPGALRYQVLLTDGLPTHHESTVSHEGEEFCVVMAGELLIEVDGVPYTLGAGEALHYDSALPHRMSVLTRPSRLLMVI